MNVHPEIELVVFQSNTSGDYQQMLLELIKSRRRKSDRSPRDSPGSTRKSSPEIYREELIVTISSLVYHSLIELSSLATRNDCLCTEFRC